MHPRFVVNRALGTLRIMDVHLLDEGNYACVVNTTGHPAVTSTNAHLYVKSKYCSIVTSRTEKSRQISCKKIEKTEIISKNGLEDDDVWN